VLYSGLLLYTGNAVRCIL